MNGKIKKLLNGFGFITPEGGDKDLFFHAKSLVDVVFEELKDGDDGTQVTFDIDESGPKGPAAVNVKRA